MRRALFVLVVTACCMPLLASPAAAEQQTVRAQGDLKKMVADNGRSAVSVKLFGIKGPCEAKHFQIDVFWGTKTYQVQAQCTAGTTWTKGLYYDPDRTDGGLAEKRVRCGGFRLTYNSAKKQWRAVMPRECLSKAPNRVRVEAYGINYAGSANPDVAGPTRRLNRG